MKPVHRRSDSRSISPGLATTLSLAFLFSTAVANFTSSDWRAAGFCVPDGMYNGVPPDAGQAFDISAAIDQLATMPGMTECADCLRDMMTNGRICMETGSANSSAGATTLPDMQSGCNSSTEGIHINPDMINQPQEVLICVLAHEWYHTNQDAEDYEGNFEKPAYQAEIDCLKALGAGDPSSPAHGRLKQMEDCLESLCKPATNICMPAPDNGGQCRVGSPSGGSILSISAPRSARMRVRYGPGR